MEILIGLAVAAALLYFWLIGHWFARVLVFLGLAPTIFVVLLATSHYSETAAAGAIIIAGSLGLALAWPLAGLPVYYWRHRIKLMIEQGNCY